MRDRRGMAGDRLAVQLPSAPALVELARVSKVFDSPPATPSPPSPTSVSRSPPAPRP